MTVPCIILRRRQPVKNLSGSVRSMLQRMEPNTALDTPSVSVHTVVEEKEQGLALGTPITLHSHQPET